ncbi:MAG: hypothetical protein GY928_04975 [Colwellia sp.]|nr:hypothetical protein [Colwellia sp.]
MSRLNASFMDIIKRALNGTRFSAKDFIFEDSSSHKTLIGIQFKYDKSFNFEITEEEEIETITEKGPFASAALGTSERKNKSVMNYVVYSPGEYKLSDKIDIYDIGNATEYIRKWCDYIYDEVTHKKDDDSSYDSLREQIEEQLEESVENESDPFNDEELRRINNKFDDLLKNFEALKEENKITQAELNKVQSDFEDFKSSAQNMPKGLWARVTNNKLVDIVVAFGKSKEGRDFIISEVKKLVA